MQTLSTALAAIVLYLAAPLRIAIPSARRATASPCERTQTIALLFVAALAHAVVLHTTVGAADGFDLGIFEAASLAGWVIGATVLAIMFWRPVDSLALVIHPAVAVTIALAAWFLHSRIMPSATPFGQKLHIVLSIIAWGIFASLLVGRWRFGWRGPRAIKFVGTKVVPDLILRRV